MRTKRYALIALALLAIGTPAYYLLCCPACQHNAQSTQVPTSATPPSPSRVRAGLSPEPTTAQEKLPRVATAKQFVLTCMEQRLTREQVIQRIGGPRISWDRLFCTTSWPQTS